MAFGDTPIRTFISVSLSPLLTHEVEELLHGLKIKLPGISWGQADKLHFTLVFLGSIAEERLPAVIQACHETLEVMIPFSVSLGRLGVFSPGGQPRIIWLGLSQGELEMITLQKNIFRALSSRGFNLEKRKYVPHLTLGRVRVGKCIVLPPEYFNPVPGSAATMLIEKVNVMRSDLQSSRALHTLLAECELGKRP
ncbi:RNA 2',3'-cyclic phosphodiesterase [bacterium]|nr:RNA 2',3'-cyclic phosphodiesterase [bacterium]